MQNIKKHIFASCAFALLSLTCLAMPQKPSPQRLVNDFAGLFTASQTAALERALTAFDDSTSNQIAVVTVSDLEGYAPAEYATRLGLEWQVGSERFNNGIVVLVKPKTVSGKGETAVAVGYGLEGAIPDAYAKRIIENEMIPHFRNNDYFSGVSAACQVLMKLASGEISEPREAGDGGGIISGILAILLVVGIFVFLFIMAIKEGGGNNGGGNNGGGHRGIDGDDLARAIIIGNILGGPSRRGRSSGGWGSPGGGSRGGFGGFGGGSFGGGGASGSW